MMHNCSMYRQILEELKKWHHKVNRKPIILRGARQVGKTTVIRQLGEDFDNFIEINFEESPELATFFDGNLNPDEIITNLQNYLNVRIENGRTLLFFDEIQACSRALLSLRYFFEKRPELHILAAGSLIDFELESISFPVGRVDFYYLYPLNFIEFLYALGKEKLVQNSVHQTQYPQAIHKQLLSLLRDYTIIGGMPQVVKEYIESGDLVECQNIQSSIIETFQADFPKYAKKNRIKYLSTVFNAIPLQLGRKLKYTNISNLYKARELGSAFELLEKAGLVIPVYHTSANGLPLEYEKNFKKFKAIFFDIGLALRILHVPIKELFLNDDITLINEGGLAEQFVGQELLAYSSCREKGHLYYWHREAKSSNAEIDYVIESDGKVLPIEVKSGLKGKIKSLQIFINEKTPELCYCFTRNQFRETDGIRFAPLYSISELNKGLSRPGHISNSIGQWE